jgi:hypothetical protein
MASSPISGVTGDLEITHNPPVRPYCPDIIIIGIQMQT